MKNREQLIRSILDTVNDRPADSSFLTGLMQDYADSINGPVVKMDDGFMRTCALHAVAAAVCDEDPCRVEMIHEIIARLENTPTGALARVLKILTPPGRQD